MLTTREELKINVMMNIASQLGSLSTCNRAHIGCVITNRDFQILSTGYNGAPKGSFHCTQVGCLMNKGHCVRTNHAEQNAIITASRNLEDSLLFTSTSPCFTCVTLIIQAGIKEVFFYDWYETDPADAIQELCIQAGVELIQRPRDGGLTDGLVQSLSEQSTT